jgi:hypothetical protein
MKRDIQSQGQDSGNDLVYTEITREEVENDIQTGKAHYRPRLFRELLRDSISPYAASFYQ